MARFVFVALCVALVCVMQVQSAPAEDATPDPLQDTIKNAQENIKQFLNSDQLSKTFNENVGSLNDNLSKAFQDAKPKLDELMAKGQEFLDSIIPKSEEPKKTT